MCGTYLILNIYSSGFKEGVFFLVRTPWKSLFPEGEIPLGVRPSFPCRRTKDGHCSQGDAKEKRSPSAVNAFSLRRTGTGRAGSLTGAGKRTLDRADTGRSLRKPPEGLRRRRYARNKFAVQKGRAADARGADKKTLPPENCQPGLLSIQVKGKRDIGSVGIGRSLFPFGSKHPCVSGNPSGSCCVDPGGCGMASFQKVRHRFTFWK